MSEQQQAYSYAELSARFGVSTRTLRSWRAAGRLKPAVASNGKRTTRLVVVDAVTPEREPQ